MPSKILVAYDTRNGSTVDVAETIASRFRDKGCSVEVSRARDVRDVSAIDALVVGAPIYSGSWLAGAHRLLKRVDKLPSDRRPHVAIFALGPRRDDGPQDWVRPRGQFERALGKHPSIAPVSTALFGGADPPKKTPRRDIRDWAAIQAWADELAGSFGCA
jgi:menaquinone-dependent protoporphyrinogen oxidase